MEKRPIGIFDSGVGGLTVFKEIRKQFPNEDIVYFGDTARVPYGPKSKNTIKEYSLQNARFLMQQNAKIIIIACNTASSVAVNFLRRNMNIPVIGVISPGAEYAVLTTKHKKVGIIGTEGTIRSKAYPTAIKDIENSIEVFSKACPLFVSIVEEGWESHSITKDIIKEYLSEIKDKDIDTLVLGCTHYPILKSAIKEFMGNDVNIIDSALVVAEKLKDIIPNPEKRGKGKNRFFVSDNETKFKEIAERIIEKKIKNLTRVKLGEVWYL